MKNKFIKSTLILLSGGIITKIFSFIIRIYFTRIVGTEGIGIYSLVMPTYSLLITITTLSFPLAISNIIAKGKKRGKNVFFSTLPISLILNFFLILIVILSSKIISINLLHNKDTYYPLLALSFVLPFISIASILRGYFFGKQQMIPHTISNVIEQIFKLLIVILILPKIFKYGLIITITGYILISILSETMSIIIFLLFLPKNFKIEKKDLKPDINTTKEVLKISLPSVGSRLIGNIGYFFEPIILTNIMIKLGYSSTYITTQYGIYNTYTLGILLVPTYLLTAISTALLPEISKNHNNKKQIRKIFNKVTIFSFIFGLIANSFLFLTCEFFLKIIFHTTEGATYIRFMSFFFTLYYLEPTISSTLHALGQTKYLMKTTIYSVIIKLITMTIFLYLNTGIYSLIIAEIINILVVVILNYKKLNLCLKN